MEKITLQQQEISGWKDQDQAETYSSLYNRAIQTNACKNQLQKKEEISSKSTNQHHKKLQTKFSLNFKESNRNYQKHKLRDSEELVNDRKTLLQYLQSETCKLYLKSQKLSLQTLTNANNYQKELMNNESNLLETNNEVIFCQSNLQLPLDKQTFKELFLKESPEKKSKKKRFFLNTKLMCQLGKNKYRCRQSTNFASKSYLKKQNLSNLQEQEKVIEKKDFNRHKIKQFPLFFREVEERQQQLNKKGEKAKNHFKVHKKMYKSQMPLTYVDHQFPLRQFLDNKLFSTNVRV